MTHNLIPGLNHLQSSLNNVEELQNIPTYKQYHTVQCLDHTAYSVYSINSGVLLLLPVYTTTLANGVLNC